MVHTEHKTRPRRDQAINIRANRQQRDLIDRAAATLGKTRSEFIIDTASREAESVLLDRVFIQIDDRAFDEFNALLDNPPPPTDRLRALLASKTPWE